MGSWWPFRNEDSSKQDVPLDAGLQQYYDDVVAKGKQQEEHTRKPERVAGPVAPSNTRIRPTTDTFSSQKSVKQIALDNCVEYEKAYSTCLLHGTYLERFGGCPTQLTMYEQCQDMQQQALKVLGFAGAQSDAQKRAIKAQADDLMIKTAPSLTITDTQVEAFTRALSDLARD